MKKEFLRTAAILVLSAAAGVAQADEGGMGIGVGAQYSTLGAGVQVGKSFSDSFNLRLGLNKYSKSDTQTIDDIQYNATLDLSSTALLLDWNPLSGSFHITVGYLNNGSTLDAVATPASNVQVGDTTYTPAEVGTLTTNVNLGSGAYVGFGWGSVPASGFGFTFDLGVVQMGTPDVTLSSTGVISQTDIYKEAQNIQSDLDEFDTYPVVGLGISYGF